MIATQRDNDLLKFLIELRKRLLICFIALSATFTFLLYFANHLYTWLAFPLLKQLAPHHQLIATNIAAPFFVPFQLTFFVSIFLCVPIFLYQLWAFIAPALYTHEKRFVWPLLFFSTSLFYLGIAFAYFIIFPILFSFFISAAPLGVIVSPDISLYLDFTLKLFFVFGVMFEVPVVIALLIFSKIVTRHQLIQLRPYIIVAAFVIAMFIAPPDVLSQTLLAVPMWFLYEAGLFFSRFFKSK